MSRTLFLEKYSNAMFTILSITEPQSYKPLGNTAVHICEWLVFSKPKCVELSVTFLFGNSDEQFNRFCGCGQVLLIEQLVLVPQYGWFRPYMVCACVMLHCGLLVCAAGA